jgi:hypothetical protein
VIRREVPIHPRNNDSETKISFQVLINITPINDGGIINDSGIIIKFRKENELVIEVPSVHDKPESSVVNLALSLMVSFVLEIEDRSHCFG